MIRRHRSNRQALPALANVRRWLALAAMVLLVLTGFPVSGHAGHAGQTMPSGPSHEMSICHGTDDCPADPHDQASSSCCVMAAVHACCILTVAGDIDLTPLPQSWPRPDEPILAGLVRAPAQHPPSIATA
ncbi:MAG TPA: hypothetical protein VHL31_19785 [Geminicoccus sp.]|jgi:hypothetical protein|uniref:hypothetical protein n=1 Tax=Geminicoccus sp. TaxID=2024832 RepID=UPI002E3341A5|nr:hypothetical protein [Geminicoccus sp.]HEX2528525.1 hypothetical protein [Geminicoccus sp.]